MYWLERVRVDVTHNFGVSEENDNGKNVVYFCAESAQCVSNTYFEHRSLCKYTKVTRAHDGTEEKA